MSDWQWRPGVLAVLITAGVLFMAGWVRLRARAPTAARPSRLALDVASLAVIFLALASPIDDLGDQFLTAHMIQHALLLLVAPPLLLLANPFPVTMWGIPARLRRRVAALLVPHGSGRAVLFALTTLPVAWIGSATIFWAWHVPSVYDAALRREWLHDVEHVSFLAAGLLFWWPLIPAAPRVRPPARYHRRLVYLLSSRVTMLLPELAIAGMVDHVIYAHYAAHAVASFGPLEDQAIAWGVMGGLDGIATSIAFVAVFWAMAVDEERRLGAEPAPARLRERAS